MSLRMTMAACALLALSTRPPVHIAGQQGGLAGLGGLGDLVHSLFAHDAYVGSRQFDLFHLKSRGRLAWEGFSIVPPPGNDWVQAAPLNEYRPDVIQEIWFVRNAHRFTARGNRTRITARPITAFARLVFVGDGLAEPLPQAIESWKRTELRNSRVDVISLAVRPDTHAESPCVRYEATLLDRGVPPGFEQQVFEVTAAGIVCPHPDAAWLAVEVGHTRRRAPGEAVAAPTADLATFVDGLRIDPLAAPLVVDIRTRKVTDGMVIRPATARAVFVGNELWMSYASEGGRVFLSRIGAEQHSVAQVADHGPIVAATSTDIWLNSHDGTVTRIATDSGEVAAAKDVCEPWLLARVVAFTDPQPGVWVGCVLRDSSSVARRPARGVTRLDPRTGQIIATIPLAENPLDLYPSGHGVWVLEEPLRMGDRFRAHKIDAVSNRIVHTLVLPKSNFTRMLIVDERELWISRERDKNREILVIDPATNAVRHVLELPDWLSVNDVAFVDQDSVWLTAAVAARDGRGLAAFGANGALLRVDRRTKQVSRRLIPVGLTSRAVGTSDAGIWLHDRAGTFLLVSHHPPHGLAAREHGTISVVKTPSTARPGPARSRNGVRSSRGRMQ